MAMTMRERIANAIVDELGVSRGLLDCVDDVVMAEIREAVADAVLAELQTPTDGMGQEIADYVYTSIGRMTAEDGKMVFSAAILAAREGK